MQPLSVEKVENSTDRKYARKNRCALSISEPQISLFGHLQRQLFSKLLDLSKKTNGGSFCQKLEFKFTQAFLQLQADVNVLQFTLHPLSTSQEEQKNVPNSDIFSDISLGSGTLMTQGRE